MYEYKNCTYETTASPCRIPGTEDGGNINASIPEAIHILLNSSINLDLVPTHCKKS